MVQALGDTGQVGPAGQTGMMMQQPNPLEMMARLPQGARGPRGGAPIGGEEFAERAGFGIDQPARQQIDQGIGPIQPALLARGPGQGVTGFEQVHMRILPARQGAQTILGETAMVGRQMVLDEVHHPPGACKRLGLTGRARVPGAGEQHEGQIIKVHAIIDRRPVGHDDMAVPPVGIGAGSGQEVIAVVRRQEARPGRIEAMGMGEDIDQPRGHQGRATRCRVGQAIGGQIFQIAGLAGTHGARGP